MRVIRCGVRKPVRYHSNFKSTFKLVSDKKKKMVRKVGDLIVKSSIRGDFLTTIELWHYGIVQKFFKVTDLYGFLNLELLGTTFTSIERLNFIPLVALELGQFL